MRTTLILAVLGACGVADAFVAPDADRAVTAPVCWTGDDGVVYPARPDSIAVLPGEGQTLAGEAMGTGTWRLVPVDAGVPLAEALAAARAGGADYAAPVLTGPDGGPIIPTRDLLIGVADDSPGPAAALGARVDAEARRLGLDARITSPWAALPVYRVTTDAARGDDVLALARRLASLPNITFAEPDMLFTGRSSYTPNDPLFSQAWGLRNTGQSGGLIDADMDADEAWDTTRGDGAIITLVIDTGVDQSHPDINQLPGYDATGSGTGGGPGNQCDNHGTPVAGCISAIIDNDLGAVGVAPWTRTVSARAFNSNLTCDGSWSASYSWTVDCLNHAALIGARVTNNSNYYGGSSSAIAAAYASTRTLGMVHFASAGNENAGFSTYPASLPTVSSIGAINRYGNRASFSNYGPTIFATAPGQDIRTTDRRGSAGWSSGDYVWASGTSFASPSAAGIAALVLSVDPSLSAAEVETILAETADDYGVVGRDDTFGWGVLNAAAAVAAAAGGPCSGVDLAPPYGVLDLADIVEFVGLFLVGDGAVDLAPPFGVWDLADLVAFAELFTGGCP